MTSNVGARLITEKQQSLGFNQASSEEAAQEADFEKTKDLVMGELKALFRPEFLNRVDDIIVFHQLTGEQIERIADGYYYAKTVRLLKHLLTNPELLDTPAKEEIRCEY